MHVALERAVQAAEVASAVTPPSFPLQRLLHFISELLYIRDSQVAMISERCSLLCLQLSALKPSGKGNSRSDIPTMQRPVSPASTLSSRRSVLGMKQLLPLKLQASPPLPKVVLSSRLENATPTLQPPPISFDSEIESTLDTPDSSWIPRTSPPAVRLSQGLSQSYYREAPIYLNPGSPMPSRAYLSDEELCHQCQPKGSECDELCILSEYENAETNSNSRDSFFEYTELFDADKIGSLQTSPTLSASFQLSKLSIERQSESIPQMDATWMDINSNHQSEGAVYESAFRYRDDNVEHEERLPGSWLDSESSQSSCSSSYNEVLDVSTFLVHLSIYSMSKKAADRAIGICNKAGSC